MIPVVQKSIRELSESEIISDLRYYQKDLYLGVRDQFKSGKKSVIVQLATGGGKGTNNFSSLFE